MSLINDALRGANSNRPSAGQSSAPVPAMQPVEPARSSRALPLAVLVAGVAVLAVAAALFFRGRTSETKQVAQNESAATPAVLPAQAVTETPIAAAPEPVTQPQSQVIAATPAPVQQYPEPVKSVVTPTTPPPVQQSAPAIVSVPTPTQPQPQPTIPPAPSAETKSTEVNVAAATQAPAEAKSPAVSEFHESRPPRLQAIYYRLRRPTVIINGKTLGPGDSIDGLKVVSIQRSSVEVVQDGKYRTLTMQD